jgi:hypothetical protein
VIGPQDRARKSEIVIGRMVGMRSVVVVALSVSIARRQCVRPMITCAFLVVLACASIAHADGKPAAPAPEPKQEEELVGGFAAGASLPINEAYALSLYFRLTDHQVIRANIGRWTPFPAGDHLGGGARENPRSEYDGGVLDVGAGWMLFAPLPIWGGPTFELGVLVRNRDTEEQHTMTEQAGISGRGERVASRQIAASALIGWSLPLHPRFFIATAVGFVAGYERGTRETERRDVGQPVSAMTHRISGMRIDGEYYIRLGVVLGE